VVFEFNVQIECVILDKPMAMGEVIGRINTGITNVILCGRIGSPGPHVEFGDVMSILAQVRRHQKLLSSCAH
jgi:hypothetical protein